MSADDSKNDAKVEDTTSGGGERKDETFENLELPLNKKQMDLLAKVRKRLPAASRSLALAENVRFWRFIKGHKFVEEKAVEVIGATIAWRRKIWADDALGNIRKKGLQPHQFPFAEHARKLFPMLELPQGACDRKGRPLWFLQFGKVTAEPLMNGEITLDELEEYLCYQYESKFEYLHQLSHSKKFLERYYIVVDLDGLSMAHTGAYARQTFRKVAGILSSNYCESSARIAIINAPFIFRTIWTVIKPWLPERTIKKISIHGTDYASALLSDIDSKFVPTEYGGTLVLKPPKQARSMLPPVDAKFTKKVVVAAGAKSDVTLKVKQGDRVRWRARVEYKDIDVVLAFAGGSHGDFRRVRDAVTSASGFFVVPSDGTVTMSLDNSRAWMASKTVHTQLYIA